MIINNILKYVNRTKDINQLIINNKVLFCEAYISELEILFNMPKLYFEKIIFKDNNKDVISYASIRAKTLINAINTEIIINGNNLSQAVKTIKLNCIHKQEYENAAFIRDIEKTYNLDKKNHSL